MFSFAHIITGSSVITKKAEEKRQDDDKYISVTSKRTHKITESIDIVTKDNASDEIVEKDEKYQFTMSVPNKQTFYDTLSSLTTFLEGEKKYNEKCFNPNTLKPNLVIDNEVISSDETEGSQAKSEKSFVGKMSKRIFGVFKKDENEKLDKKKGRKKKHEKDKGVIAESNLDSPKIVESEQIILPSQDNEINKNDDINVPTVNITKEGIVQMQVQDIPRHNKLIIFEKNVSENIMSGNEINLPGDKVIFPSTNTTNLTSNIVDTKLFTEDLNIKIHNENTEKLCSKIIDKESIASNPKESSSNGDVNLMDSFKTNTDVQDVKKESGTKEPLAECCRPNRRKDNFIGTKDSLVKKTDVASVNVKSIDGMEQTEELVNTHDESGKQETNHLITSNTKCPSKANEEENTRLLDITIDANEILTEVKDKSLSIDTPQYNTQVSKIEDNPCKDFPTDTVGKQMNTYLDEGKKSNDAEVSTVIDKTKERKGECEQNVVKASGMISEKSKTKVNNTTKLVIDNAKATKEKSKSFLGGLFKKSDAHLDKEKNNEDLLLQSVVQSKSTVDIENKPLHIQLSEVNTDLNYTISLPKLDTDTSDNKDIKSNKIDKKTNENMARNLNAVVNKGKDDNEIFVEEISKLSDTDTNKSKTKVINGTESLTENVKEGKEKSKSFLGGLFKKSDTHLEKEKNTYVSDASDSLKTTEPILNTEYFGQAIDDNSTPLDITESSLQSQLTDNDVGKNTESHSMTIKENEQIFNNLEKDINTLLNQVKENNKIVAEETSKVGESSNKKEKTKVNETAKNLTNNVKESKEKSKSFLGGLFKKSDTHGEKEKDNYVPVVSLNLKTTEPILNVKENVNTGQAIDQISCSVAVTAANTGYEGRPDLQTQSDDVIPDSPSVVLETNNTSISDINMDKSVHKDDKALDNGITTTVKKKVEYIEVLVEETSKLNEAITDESKTKVNDPIKSLTDNDKESKEKSKSFLGGLFKKSDFHSEKEKDNSVPIVSSNFNSTIPILNDKQDVNTVYIGQGIDQISSSVLTTEEKTDNEEKYCLNVQSNDTIDVKNDLPSMLAQKKNTDISDDKAILKDDKPINDLEGNTPTVIKIVKENSEIFVKNISKQSESITDKSKIKVNNATKSIIDNVKESKEKPKSFLGGLFKKSDTCGEKVKNNNDTDISPNLNTSELMLHDKQETNTDHYIGLGIDQTSTYVGSTKEPKGCEGMDSLQIQSNDAVNINTDLLPMVVQKNNISMSDKKKEEVLIKQFDGVEGNISRIINNVEENSETFIKETSELSDSINDQSKTKVNNATKCVTDNLKENKEKSKSFLSGLFQKSDSHEGKERKFDISDSSTNSKTAEPLLKDKHEVPVNLIIHGNDQIHSSVDKGKIGCKEISSESLLSDTATVNEDFNSKTLPKSNENSSDMIDKKAEEKSRKSNDVKEDNKSAITCKMKESDMTFVGEIPKWSGSTADKCKTEINNSTKYVTDSVKESNEKTKSILGGLFKKANSHLEKDKNTHGSETSFNVITAKTISINEPKSPDPILQENDNINRPVHITTEYLEEQRKCPGEFQLTEVVDINSALNSSANVHKSDLDIRVKDCKVNERIIKSNDDKEGKTSIVLHQMNEKSEVVVKTINDASEAIGNEKEKGFNSGSVMIDNAEYSKENSNILKKSNVYFEKNDINVYDIPSNLKTTEAMLHEKQDIVNSEQVLKGIDYNTISSHIGEEDKQYEEKPILEDQLSDVGNLAHLDSMNIPTSDVDISDTKGSKSEQHSIKNNKSKSFVASSNESQNNKCDDFESSIDKRTCNADRQESSNYANDFKVKTELLETYDSKNVESVVNDSKNKLYKIKSDISDTVNLGVISVKKEISNDYVNIENAGVETKLELPISKPLQSNIKSLDSESKFMEIDSTSKEDHSIEISNMDDALFGEISNLTNILETDKSINLPMTKLSSDSGSKSNKEENKIFPTTQDTNPKSGEGATIDITSNDLKEPKVNVREIYESIEPDNTLKSNELSNLRISNEDKLNNILIDMLIEQECMTHIHGTPTTKTPVDDKTVNVEPSKLANNTKTATTDSNIKSNFQTVASYSKIETLVCEDDLDKRTKGFTAEHTSYVTTPTMERRKIGGSQRLSREERPALRDVSHILDYSSSEDDEINQYIVTEPYDPFPPRKVTFHVESEDETYLKVSETSSEPDLEVTEMTPSPDPTSNMQGKIIGSEKPNKFDDFAKSRVKADKNIQKVERRFERMASETLDADPDSKTTADREFQRMVSQLSTEEVDAYLNQWEEEGLTPSDELDSTSHTVEGDLDPDVEALPEASLGSRNPFFTSDSQWIDFEHDIQDVPSIFWAFNTTPTSAVIQPNELDIPVRSISVTGETTGEESKKDLSSSATREAEEALLDLASGLQESKGGVSGPGSAPSSTQ